MLKAWLERRWYSARPPPPALQPLAALFGAVAGARRKRLSRIAVRTRVAVPVIVVGNISLGGTGKTPFVIWLVQQLREWGWRPGIVSRGYGGRAPQYPFAVTAESAPEQAGDEPVLMARRLHCPLMVAPDRVAAAQRLADSGAVDILVADDGLQHYRLPRDREFCVVDGVRGLGNGALLPAGPLREPASRLAEVDFVVANGGGGQVPGRAVLRMALALGDAYALRGAQRSALSGFAGASVHAVAGIGNPQRFFDALQARGLQVLPHPFDDHHAFRPQELDFGDGLPVLMTEKDAVKCRAFSGERHWAVPVDAVLAPSDAELVRQSISILRRST